MKAEKAPLLIQESLLKGNNACVVAKITIVTHF